MLYITSPVLIYLMSPKRHNSCKSGWARSVPARSNLQISMAKHIFLNILLNANFLKSFLFILHGQHWSAEMLFSWASPKAPSSMYLQNYCFKGKGQWGLVPYILKLLPRSLHVTPSHTSLRKAGHKQMPYPLTPEPHPSSKEAGMYDFSKCPVGGMEHS